MLGVAMKLLKVLKAIDMLRTAMTQHSELRKKEGMNKAMKLISRSRLGFDYLSFVSTRLTDLERKFLNGHFAFGWKRNRCRSLRTTTPARRYIRTSGLRSFGKAYGVRGFRSAFGAQHLNRLKLHLETPNVEITGLRGLPRRSG